MAIGDSHFGEYSDRTESLLGIYCEPHIARSKSCLRTYSQRAVKVILTLIACYFIWSVSQDTTVGWGIRLRMTLKKWHRQADLTDLIKSLVAEPEIHDRTGMSALLCQIF